MRVEYVIERHKAAGTPKEMPADAFRELKASTALRTRRALGIKSVKRGNGFVWVFPDVLTKVIKPEPEAEVRADTAQTSTDATRLWQDSMSIGGPTPLDVPSPYAPPQGNVSPTASLGVDLGWVGAAARDSYVVAPDGTKKPTRFWGT